MNFGKTDPLTGSLKYTAMLFWLLSQFYYQKRLYLIYGNHDIVKQNSSFATLKCKIYYCDATQCYLPLFPGITFQSGIILWDKNHKKDIYLTHGHQADFFEQHPLENSSFSCTLCLGSTGTNRFFQSNQCRTQSHKKAENRRTTYPMGKKSKIVSSLQDIPTARCSAQKIPLILNTGSCVHPRCITCIEIEHRCLTLVENGAWISTKI